ncbi:MAG: LytTR family DNA-binding domain-containing protein [Bacteroidota bacterium]
MLRALIIDDEFLARRRVEKLLSHFRYVKLIGEAKSGSDAVRLINLKVPDLIFLDVEMPDFGGFDVINKLDTKTSRPYIIFTTAYDHYAVKAFEIHAIDYLLKPLEIERFEAALERAKEQIALKKSEAANAEILQMLNRLNAPFSRYKSSFEIKEKGRLKNVPTEEIYLIIVNGNYLELITGDKKYLYRSTMNAIVEALDPNEFLRVHRSYLLNTRYIQSCKYLTNNEYRFLLKNKREVLSSRRYKDQVISFLERENQ